MIIDLPDYGYVWRSIQPVNAGGAVPGSLGGPSDYMDRPGYRFSVTYQTRELRSSDEARRFEALLEQGSGNDVSYPWPLDYAPMGVSPTGVPLINGASPAGDNIPLKGLVAGFQFRLGQPLAVISGGVGFIHKVRTTTIVPNGGTVVLPVFPDTRVAFINGDLVEVQKPRLRGILTYDGSEQPAYGRRAFRFTITERI